MFESRFCFRNVIYLLIEAILLVKMFYLYYLDMKKKNGCPNSNGFIPTVFERNDLLNHLNLISKTENNIFRREIYEDEKESIENFLILI